MPRVVRSYCIYNPTKTKGNKHPQSDGSNISQIIPLVTRNFIALVGLSCFIAFPVAWYFMSNWLKIFSYNTGLSITPFILSAFAVLIITLLTVIFHTLRAAIANPVKALRTE